MGKFHERRVAREDTVRASAVFTPVIELIRYRQLCLSLAWRDVRVRYKQSLLGLGWAILLPLAMMLVFTFVFTRAVDVRGRLGDGLPYALFVFTGLVPWTFFGQSLTSCANVLVANRNLITKVYFPREVFPLSAVGGGLLDFGIALIVLAGLGAYFHLTGAWTIRADASMLFLPVVVAAQSLLTIGLGMMLATANVFYRDVRQGVGVVVQLGMFMSGVVVPVPQDGSRLSLLLAWNPMVPLIQAYRDVVLHGQLPAGRAFLYSVVVAFGVLVVGWYWFRRASRRFAEVI